MHKIRDKMEGTPLRLLFLLFVFVWFVLAGSLYGGGDVLAADPITPGDFAGLKTAIESPNRDTVIVVPGGKYVFTDTINVSKDLTIQNAPGETVEFVLGMFNEDAYSLGKTMLNVTGGTITFDGEDNSRLVFDGTSEWDVDHHSSDRDNLDHVTNGTNVSKNGVFLTVGPQTKAVINHATFANSYNKGALTGAIFVDYTGALVMNDGLITHNFYSMQQTAANRDLFDPSLTREFNGQSPSIALIGGSFEMNGGKIHNNYTIYGHGGAITAMGANHSITTGQKGNLVRSSITINSGEISLNSAHDFTDAQNAHGGALYLESNVDTIINDGLFSDNYSYGGGGFVFTAWTTSLTINGGTFTNNWANRSGGAIATSDYFVSYDPTKTEVFGDLNTYNIKTVEDWYKLKLGTIFRVNGGTFSENKSYMGGAIYIASDQAEINAGVFTNNEANRFGGAIYVSTVPYRLKIRNAYIADNYADESYGTLGTDYYPDMDKNIYHTGSGGGVWYCPTGSGSLNVSNGAAIFDNTATIEGDDLTSMNKVSDDADYSVSVSNRILGGGWVDWYNDTMTHRYAEQDEPLAPIKNREDDLMLKSVTSSRAKETARALATTIFTGNKAKRGGAIGSNGHIDFGDADYEFDLTVNKTWSDKIANKGAVQVQLLVVTDDGEFEVERVTLNEENGYSHTFKGLPLESNGKVTYKVHELEDVYDVSYNYRLNEGDAVQSDSFSTKPLVNGDHVTMEVHNEKKPTPLFDLKVVKQWDSSISEKKSVSFKLFSRIDEQETELEEISLTEENGFSHTFESLPAYTQDDKPVIYRVEENGSDYAVSYYYNIGDGEQLEGASVSGADLSDGAIVTLTIKNSPKPEKPEQPTVPDKPETPAVPDKPETPAVPEKPETPAVPEKPEKPAVPEKPEKPAVPEKPEKPASVPETGDHANSAMLFMLMTVSLSLMACTAIFIKRRLK